jgi:ribose transport system ATP-binding protein
MGPSPELNHAAPDAVRMEAISKSFGGVAALDRVDFGLRYGEIHALLGENGAGKSTLLKILRGVVTADAGTIAIAGRWLAAYTPEAVRQAGIAMIFQETSLIPSLTVAQNVYLNREPRDRFGLIDDRAALEQTRRNLDAFAVDIDPGSPVSALGAGQRQLTEIVKAVSQHTRILILDEPTSALSTSEVEHLFALLRRLKSEGVAIVYVSHRMDEIMEIADRVTILRDGRHVLTEELPHLTLDVIIERMIGRRSGGFATPEGAAPGEALLELRGISTERKLQGIDLTLRRGEVVGVAGLLGSGRSTLARVIYGMEPVSAGEIRVMGRKFELNRPQDAIAAGIALVPEDRNRQGVIAAHSVAANLILVALDRISRKSWISRRESASLVSAQMRQMRIKADSPDTPVRALSGGNQQKVVIGKWLAMDPDILVLDEPTAGIDIGSKAEIVALIREMARRGKAILLISSESAELLAAADRIVIMRDGRITRELRRDALDPAAGEHGDPALRQQAEHRLQMAIQETGTHG